MKTDDFDFELPPEAVAARPASPRDSARLLEVGRQLFDRGIRDLPALLRPDDVLVVNDTRVIPARLTGRRGDARVEVTLHRHIRGGHWRAFARPAKRLRPSDRIDFAAGFSAEVTEKGEHGEVRLAFTAPGEMLDALEQHGRMPLPPYIPRDDGPDAADNADYQTIYADAPGAVAAPTAGLHFTDALLDEIHARGIAIVKVTLHVGAGTFLPVRSERIEDHRMHAEWGRVPDGAAETINRARGAGGRVVAVGTSSLRLLETASDRSGAVAPFSGETDLFITPGYRFRTVDLLLTNFHQPRSTLFMLVAAFAGLDRMRAAYAHARDSGYRFYSYGDATLLHRQGQT